ncbi:MAG: hypothetical protein KA885_01630 [Spirochaetes bacterium]|nr:hypothetical protein [Spirochaetota bacterium]
MKKNIIIIALLTISAFCAFAKDEKLKLYISDFISQNADEKEMKLIEGSAKHYLDHYNKFDIVDKDILLKIAGGSIDLSSQESVLNTATQSGIEVVINGSVVKTDKKYIVKLWALDSKSGVVKQSVERSTPYESKLEKIVKKMCHAISFGDARNSIDNIFEKKTLVLKLNETYKKTNLIIGISDFISNSEYDISTGKGSSFLNGYLRKKIPADYIYCSYDSSRLSNIYLIFQKNQKNENAFSDYEALLTKYLGANFVKEGDAIYRTSGEKTAKLFNARLGDKDFIIIHYYLTDKQLNFDEFSARFLTVRDKLSYKKNFEFQIGGEHGSITAFKFLSFKKNYYNNNVLEKVEYGKISSVYPYSAISFNVPFSFAYSINSTNSIGLTFTPSYILSFNSLGDNFYNSSIMFNLLFKYKYGEYRRKSRFLLEFGVNLNHEYLYDLKSGSFKFVNYNADYDKINLYIPRMYLTFGPSLLIGSEYNNKNFFMAVGGFVYGSFGFGSYDGANLTPESLSVNISFGTRVRFGYRGLVFVK